MTHVDHLVVPAAFVIIALSIALSAIWRRTLKPWWLTMQWQPRITPGIRAEVIMVMGMDGHVGIQFEKMPPEENVSEVFAQLTSQWFAVGESLGVYLDWTSRVGGVRQTPDGPEYIVGLVRPTTPKVRDAALEPDVATVDAITSDAR